MLSEIATYLRLGVHHIADIRGYDHILFVAALTIGYRLSDWARLLWLVTAFTLGHSITLALATLDLLRADPRLVEIGIAGSIAVTAFLAIVGAVRSGAGGTAEGPTPAGQGLRYAVAAGFGLIHGLGFSTFLRSLLGDEESLFVPLLSFNVGLEVGQIAIVLAVLLHGVVAERILRLNRRDWVLVVSGGIAAISLTMVAERIGG
jgi:hypothetical protein